MTPGALLIDRCGLSQREAATFLGVGLDAVKSWSIGRNRMSPAVQETLRDLYRRIERAAGETLIMLDAAPGDAEIELGFVADDAEAQDIGWPCVGAQRAMLGIVLARARRPVRLVPRGSTVATAGAIAAHQPPTR